MTRELSQHTLETLAAGTCCAKPSVPDFPMRESHGWCSATPRQMLRRSAAITASFRSTSASTRAPRNSNRTRRTSIRRTKRKTKRSRPTNKKIMILGSGPNRIGQGIEFDYCCCHASFALKEEGFETIMVNCNPETVSTDYDTSDRLYFEPLTLEDVLHIVKKEKPTGVIVQFGGQTPLNLALDLQRSGVPIIGTSPESIDLAEDRKRFGELLRKLEYSAAAITERP